jgi:hypothetical protein
MLIAPPSFVRFYRRSSPGDFHAKTPQWEQAVLAGGRFSGFVFSSVGLALLYFLPKVLRLV